MQPDAHSSQAPQRVIPTRRKYNTWVVDESIEDYALRYAPKSVRKWSLWTVTNTAIAAVSFLAMEALGATMLWQYGFSNAFWALLVVSLIIFLTSWPIAYYAARYNVDIDLLTRGAGFGYIGSSITSVIYASFTFIFFAFEAAIMALALELGLGLPLSIGYLVSSLIVLPLVVKGIGFINKVQAFTQPIWLFLLLLPWCFVLVKHPSLVHELALIEGVKSNTASFNLAFFGASCTVLFALITQIGEQADYLRFLPDKKKIKNKWNLAVFLGGPAWILAGFAKIFMGMLLMALALKFFVPNSELTDPNYLYWIAFQQVVAHPGVALFLTVLFVCIAQIKINVTNAYAGSLAWSNFFARLTHSHPGRVVWLVFNVFIALLLMELGVIHAVERVLGLYSNVALAWVGAIVADLIICKPLGLSPKGIEFRRAYLYDINPVGVGSLFIASSLSLLCYWGIFGEIAQSLAGFIALGTSMLCVPFIAYMTKGKYYLARKEKPALSCVETQTCVVCEHDYEVADMASCPAYNSHICSLCCTLEARCHDLCKPHARWSSQLRVFATWFLPKYWVQYINTRLSLYILLLLVLGIVLAVSLSLIYLQELSSTGYSFQQQDALLTLFIKIYAVLFLLLCVAAWWLVLNDESRRQAQQESNTQTQLLMDEIEAHKITDRQLQDARIQAEKANEAKSRYVIGISHELRTPLNSILGYSQLLQKQEQLSDKGEAALGVISRSGQHLTSLIDGLLDLARIETGKISLESSNIDFPKFLNQIVHMFEPQFMQKQLDFQVFISNKIPQYVRTDKKRLEQVLINILGNALKFTVSGRVTFKVEYRFQTAYFEIQDTGCGIAEDDIERIFQPFERGHNVIQGSFAGTGLGLPIVKLLVDILGGELKMNSQLKQGSVFKIKLYLPSKSLIHPIADVASNTVVGYSGQRRKILVVDNELTDRGLVLNFLQPLGFILEEAESGLECLRKVPVFQPDLILMDLSMPMLGGWETAKLLRKNKITNVPIIIISADANERMQNPETDVLNEDFLVKPVDLNLLLNKVGDKLGLSWIHQHEDEHVPEIYLPIQPNFEDIIDPIQIEPVQKPNPLTLKEAMQQLEQHLSIGYIRGAKEQLAQCMQDFSQHQELWAQIEQDLKQFDFKTSIQRLQQQNNALE
ncbi:response regulator [Acinetobacter wanghuae]|uniref:histidine kinase n=1 Tax=Acinetobacter wanghuae TaxID=2662362 RepID=A0A5Q0NZN8_9GAMM|nr:ATP-binding protein [Acinetobacter wanghuae]MQW91861.1 response regulator [Acinetobacter wanghuae]QGA09964.1 response regulator [Acinetobacter wanghuae]